MTDTPTENKSDLLVTDPPAAPLATIATNPLMVLESALQSGRTADELKQLYEFYRLVKSDEAKAVYDAAFLAFQGECEPLPRTGTSAEATGQGTTVKFTFCTLGDLDTALPLLRKHGFSREFGSLQIEAAKATMECTITHTGGHSVTKKADMPTSSNFLKNPQNQVMGATSYLKRLLFGNMLGIPVNDLENKLPREPIETITEEQQRTVQDLIIQSEANRVAFLEYFEVKQLGEIPTNRFEEACRMLNEKIAKRAKA